MSGDKILVLMI